MSGMTDYLENIVIRATLGGEAWGLALDPDLTLALYQGDPTEGTPANEVSGNGYERQAVTFTITQVGGVTQAVNTDDILFPIASGPWGSAVTHLGIYAGEYLIYYGPCTPTQTINTNGQFKINAETLVVTLD